MGDGIDWMIAVALFVAHLPGAVGRMTAFGVGPLLLGTAGLVLVCLLKTPLRWTGGALIVVASLWAVRAPLPDVLVSADGKQVSQVLTPDAFEEDCRRAAVVITSRELPSMCQALAIARSVSSANGAIALRRGVRDHGAPAHRAGSALGAFHRPAGRGSAAASRPTASRPAPRDATPRVEDLEAGD
ncbi:MAG: hypothetical protein EXQ83_12685 [Xanthobacteraceae bacterium]|nr:hypothetical protein [Xanthobacteraceae bacterium]